MNFVLRGEKMRIRKVKTEGRIAPIGIDIRNPVFGWVTESADSRYQTAYQIQLSKDRDFSWILADTGKVSESEQLHVRYEGPELEARTRYFLRVRIWGENGLASDFSETTFFETGLLEEEFSGKWIEPVQEEAYPEPECAHIGEVFMPRAVVPAEERLKPCQYLRKTFHTAKPVRQARLYATSHGIYEAYLNGRRIDGRYFAPEITSYQKRLFYQTYDVTTYLKEGGNALGIILADGWHIGRIGLSGDSCQYGNKLAFLGQLEILYADGTKEVIVSDDTFVSNMGKHVYADLFMGEMHDMRRDRKGFSEAVFDDRDWIPVTEAGYSKKDLVGQSRSPVVAIEELAPVKLMVTPSGETVLDFGRVIAGIVTMKAQGESGTTVTLEFCEELKQDGNFWNHIAGRNNDQRDTVILSGLGEDAFSPSFTYHGFRYVKVSGYPGEPAPENFRAVVLGTELERTLEFTTSDPGINRLQANIFNSQQGNMISLPTDCPQREKSGFTGDIQVYAATGCCNMDLEYFLKDWLGDVRTEQDPNGEIPNIVPNYPKMKSLQQRTNGCQSSAGWGDACVILPWILYEKYGNKDVLRDNYGMMKRWVSYIEQESPDNIWRNDAHFGDWLIPSLTEQGMNIDASLKEIRYIVATCYFAESARLLSKIAGFLEQEEDKNYYASLASRIKMKFRDEFLADGRLAMDYQGMYVLALAMGMVEGEQAEKLAGRLAELIIDNGYRLDTGFMSVRYLLPVLVKYGFKDLARKVLFQKQCPSWLYQIEKGATSIWEKWDAIKPDGTVSMVSFNHYSFGCVGEFLYEWIAGLKPAAPGYHEFEIRPDLDFGLDSLRMKYASGYGDMEISWEKTNDQYEFMFKIPFNTKASVILKDSSYEFEAGIHTLCCHAGSLKSDNLTVKKQVQRIKAAASAY